MALISYLLFLTLALCISAAGLRPRPLVWSSQTYGPDGPWQAVKLQVGTPPQPIDLYPGGTWESLIFAPSICNDGSTTCLARKAGVYNASKSSTSVAVPASIAGAVQNTSFQLPDLTGSASYVLDRLTVVPTADFNAASIPSLTMLVASQGHFILANGSTYPVQIGNLALGAGLVNQTWVNGTGLINGTMITSSLFAAGQTPSSSYGLHIGSAQLGIPGSLYLGGYDQLRIVGPVSAQSYGEGTLPIDLLDIGIGVVDGSSPFPYSFKSGLLSHDNDTIGGSIPIQVALKEPYLYLPSKTCEAIAQELPVTFQPDFGFYFWNTADPRYKQIVTSPSYLAFTFRFNNSVDQNFTINVPFTLLNLTLSPPLVSSPTPYFPCSPPRLPNYRLGKSFLQAAFVGVNWETNFGGVWFLAQAPGPNIALAPNVLSIGPTDRFLTPSQNDWADSWSKTLNALPMNSSAASPTTTQTPKNTQKPANTHKSLSTGAIVGIVMVAVFVCCLVAGVSWFLWRRKIKGKTGIENTRKENVDMAEGIPGQSNPQLNPWELSTGTERGSELPSMEPEFSKTELPG